MTTTPNTPRPPRAPEDLMARVFDHALAASTEAVLAKAQTLISARRDVLGLAVTHATSATVLLDEAVNLSDPAARLQPRDIAPLALNLAATWQLIADAALAPL